MILLDILEEHLEEAAFLWQQRENALSKRAYTLVQLAELEERLLAHIDGLVLAEKDGWDLLEPKLSKGEVGETLVAAFAALSSNVAARTESVRSSFAQAQGVGLLEFRHALRHTWSPEAERIARPHLSVDGDGLRCVAALDIISFRRLGIDAGLLRTILSGSDPIVRAAAINAAGRLRVAELLDVVEPELLSEHPVVRREAMTAGILLGSARSLHAIRSVISQRGEDVGHAIFLLGLAGSTPDNRFLLDALSDPKLARAVIGSLASLGSGLAVEPLIQCSANPDLARLAGDAVATITGVDLKKEKLLLEPTEKPTPKGEPEGADEEADAGDDPDEGLAAPDPAKLMVWWRSNASKFSGDSRWRLGQPYAMQVLVEILRGGNLPERHRAAFELALMYPTHAYLETSAFALLQQREIQ